MIRRAETFERLRRTCGIGTSCALALVLFAGGAGAADLPTTLPVKAPATTDYDWTGFYVGGHVGLAAGHSPWTLDPLGGGAPVAGSFGLYQSPNAFKDSGSWFLGAQGGYNWMLKNRVVLGVEGDGSFPPSPTRSPV